MTRVSTLKCLVLSATAADKLAASMDCRVKPGNDEVAIEPRAGLSYLLRMASLKDDVLAALSSVPTPEGRPLTATGKLSEIVANDGKVFFSITVEAAQVKQWESVRERAEKAVRALPGVQSVMIALTAERGAGAPSQPLSLIHI